MTPLGCNPSFLYDLDLRLGSLKSAAGFVDAGSSELETHELARRGSSHYASRNRPLSEVWHCCAVVLGRSLYLWSRYKIIAGWCSSRRAFVFLATPVRNCERVGLQSACKHSIRLHCACCC